MRSIKSLFRYHHNTTTQLATMKARNSNAGIPIRRPPSSENSSISGYSTSDNESIRRNRDPYSPAASSAPW